MLTITRKKIVFSCLFRKPLEKARSISPPPRPPPPNRSRPSSLTQKTQTTPQASPIRPKRGRKPKSRADVVRWFREEELPKRACFVGDAVLPYFHGQ